uniref:Zonadhesin-like n=1 Tax=Castor canadensis TaxID=51338 RepID=A0A8B7W171_CASCN|nr:zonadhesin-like [Castor canadensis]
MVVNICGFYMLLDPKNAKPGQKSALLSPLSQSDGCLTLSFHYILWGPSLDTALRVYASVLGSMRKHTLLSAEPGPSWKPVSVNYTGQGQIQFTVVGVFGKIPEATVAVDAISIAPCGENFPQCDFEDIAHPFCDWTHEHSDGGRWTWGSNNNPIPIPDSFGDSPFRGQHYVYFEAEKFSQAGQSVRLGSRPFCAPGDICVEFAYCMYGPGDGATLKLLLGSPAGSSPISLWDRVGSQGSDWLNNSVTIPSGYQQPMQLFFEATRGANSTFVIAVGFILISHGICRAPVPEMIPTGPATVPTEIPTVPTEESTVPTEATTVTTEETTVPTDVLAVTIEATTVTTEETTVTTNATTVPTEETTVPTEETTVTTEETTVPTEVLAVTIEATIVPTEATTVTTKETTVATEETTVPTEATTVTTEETTVTTEVTTVTTEKPTIPTEKPTIPTEVTTKEITVTTEETTVTTQQPSLAPTTSTTSTTQTTATTPTLTTESCPLNAHYESCGCAASCESPKPNCGLFCRPGCVCNPGFLFSGKKCINASSCDCFYNDNYYKPGEEWFSPNCTERCSCWPGSRIECQISQCGTRTVCQEKNGQYGCQPYGIATCFAYGALHYVTFDEKHIGFMGKCTYILAQTCGKWTDPFFRVTAKNEEPEVKGVSCLSKVYVTLPETTITLLKDRRTLVGVQEVILPVMPYKGVFLSLSGRFVELKTAFGLRVRWDGNQQLFISVTSTFSRKLCGFCGNYDGDSSNDNLKPNGSPAQDEEELGNSWQTAEDEDKECQKNEENLPSCDTDLVNKMSGPNFCGQLVDSDGVFETCLLHLKASPFFDNCISDMCSFQGFQEMLCVHMSVMTAVCQDAGYEVKPWRKSYFCPLDCPPNSKYSLCAKQCSDSCQKVYSNTPCPEQCMEVCECDPGYILSGFDCVPPSECGCISSSGDYFKMGERWFKPGCKELCICGHSNTFQCRSWSCRALETCGWQNGIYGCHAQGGATCTAFGDPHYMTFDGALHHFMGTCNYILTQPCWHSFIEQYFVVSATNEIRGGKLEVSYVNAVHVWVYDLRISLLKDHKVVLDDHRVAIPLWISKGRVAIRLSGSFILLYTNFGLQVRYDGKHLVEVTVPSSYSGRLCGLCGNYNNNSFDDNLLPDKSPTTNSTQLGAAWKTLELSEHGCFPAAGKPSSCNENNVAVAWNKTCELLINPEGPFSTCHQAVSPQASFASCVRGQCGTQGKVSALCRSLQAYASLCARAGKVVTWRNATFCPLRCPPNSAYSPCASPCPDTCLSLRIPKECPAAVPCGEGCECQKEHILSGTSCVPLSQCGCVDFDGFYHLVRERWYTESNCTVQCTCSVYNNITCSHTACRANQRCSSRDGLVRCRTSGVGMCYVSGNSQYMSFDGRGHPILGMCTHVLVKVCHPSMQLPFFKISAKSESHEEKTKTFRLHRVYIDVFNFHIILQKEHQVLINGKLVTLPATSQIQGVSITSRSIHTIVNIWKEVEVKFDGSHFLQIKVPASYYGKVCGVCGNFNGDKDDELTMSSDELAQDEQKFMNSWKDKAIDPNCQKIRDEENTQNSHLGVVNAKCRLADLLSARETCQTAFQTPAWAQCVSHVILKPFLLDCTNNLCEFGGLNHALCEALQAFEAACRNQGLKPPVWRNSSFCPLECPAHHKYTNCLPTCSPSCWDLDGRCEGTIVKVPSTCAEGCICQSGYVLKENKCVPKSECGCKDAQGGFIPLGKTWISSGCTQNCACTGGAIQCRAFSCPSGSHCQQGESDSNSCAPDKSEQCTVFGDPYYQTFDRVGYHFQGRMTYILIKTVDNLPDGVEHLLVQGRNKLYRPTSPALHEVTTLVYGYKVQLQKNLVLMVNNQKMAVPYRPNEHLRVTLRGQRLYLITDFQMVVSFDGRNDLVITLPSMYEGLVHGLCGNYDRNSMNDFMLPNGALTRDLNVFGSSWEVKTEDTLLRFPRALQEEKEGEEEESDTIRSECSPEQLALINSTQACSVLVDPKGPFAACHQTVAPESFQEHCVSDMCTGRDPKEQEELRCWVLSGYAIICQEAGASLASWRNHTHCAMTCPANTVYQSCMTPCPKSCANLLDPEDCEGPCVEGCASLPGYIYSGTQSLPMTHCGCTADGVYYQLGDSFVTEDCSQRCTCASSGMLLCEPFSCRAGETCTLGNFTRGCFRESPCLQNPCHNDGRCKEQGASFICECELGYGGNLCTEPRNIPLPKEPEAFNLVAILLGMLVSVVVIVPVLTRECVSRIRRRRW